MATKASTDSGITPETKQNNQLLVFGYIGIEINSKSIPILIKNLCIKYFELEYEILKFSTKYKSKHGLKLTDNNQCVKRIWTGYKSNKWILCDTKPIYKGVHCWRVHVCGLHIFYVLLKIPITLMKCKINQKTDRESFSSIYFMGN